MKRWWRVFRRNKTVGSIKQINALRHFSRLSKKSQLGSSNVFLCLSVQSLYSCLCLCSLGCSRINGTSSVDSLTFLLFDTSTINCLCPSVLYLSYYYSRIPACIQPEQNLCSNHKLVRLIWARLGYVAIEVVEAIHAILEHHVRENSCLYYNNDDAELKHRHHKTS